VRPARYISHLEIVLADGMRQNNELRFIRVSGNKLRSAFALASFFYLVQCLAPERTLLGRVGWLPHRRSNGAAHPCASQVCRVTSVRPRLDM